MSVQPEPEIVEITHCVNRLKQKVSVNGDSEGTGFIDPKSIKRAAAVITKSAKASRAMQSELMAELTTLWHEAQDRSFADADTLGMTSYRLCNRIQDIAITYGSNVIAQFAESLKAFSQQFDPQKPAHLTIVEAHLSVMKIAAARKIVLEDSPEALELKQALDKAIEKYSV